MSIEDEKAKIRRNLVVFCSLYLVAAFFGVSLAEIFNGYFASASIANVPVYKFLIVSTLIFLYLLFRWVTSEEQFEQFKRITGDFDVKLFDKINKWAKERAQAFNLDSYFRLRDDNAKAHQKAWQESMIAKFGDGVKYSASTVEWSSRKFESSWRLQLTVTSENHAAQLSENFPYTFSVPYGLRFKWALLVGVKIFFGSDFWEWAPPAILSFITAGWIAVRICVAVYS